jgi:uncharacterized circularly permuted ATP-grasp superfamily protein
MTIHEWLRRLPFDRLESLARDYGAAAKADGAYVITPDGALVPIPPILTPLGIPREQMKRVSADAHAITSGLSRLTADLMRAPNPIHQKLFGAFGPLEAEALSNGWRKAEKLATVRVDFLVDESGQHRALEVNATIPAMQGYSDAIAAAFLRAAAKTLGKDGDKLVDANGRNTDDLLHSLLAHRQAKSIAIVARQGDAQRGELEHYVRRWTQLGMDVQLVAPADVRIVDGKGMVGDRAPELFYRHIFARRLDPASDFARMCLRADEFGILNPIASHLEVKAMLGLLSGAVGTADAKRIGLSDEEQDAVTRCVPWTRMLSSEATRGPNAEAIADLAAWTRAHGSELVLKRSWDYGGKGVFLGADFDGPSTQSRVKSLVGREASWAELVDFALADKDAWVVQELVRAQPMTMSHDGRERKLYVDLSAFTNLGAGVRPSGGAVRAAESRIVNILGGGGLAPLVLEEVLEELMR